MVLRIIHYTPASASPSAIDFSLVLLSPCSPNSLQCLGQITCPDLLIWRALVFADPSMRWTWRWTDEEHLLAFGCMQMSVRQFLCRCRFAEVDSSAVVGDERGRMEKLCGCDSQVIGWVRHNNAA